MNWLIRQSALSVALLMVTGCPFACDTMYRFPSLEMIPNSTTINAPSSVTLRSDGLGNRCGENRPRASSVAFYVDDVRIATDAAAPFEVTWTLEPGKNGVPASGSKIVNVYAVINTAGLEETRRFPVQVNVTAAASSR
jgi:Bacterial Ig domain